MVVLDSGNGNNTRSFTQRIMILDFKKKNMTYTEEEKKQLKMAFGRMLDDGKDFLAIDIAEVEGKDLVPYIARKRFRVSLIKEGNVENR